MKLSTKVRYGSRAMVELAAAYPDELMSVKEMALRQRLSPKYLEQIMCALQAARLIKAVRGIHGGYTLARLPADINLSEVFQALEGSPAPVECVDGHDRCPLDDVCPTRDTWIEMKEALAKILEDTTIQDLVQRMRAKR